MQEEKLDFDTLVLSGGGVKGFTLLGAIQAAMDSGLTKNINTYVGTSIGSVIGYLMAIGYTPIEIVIFIHTNSKHFEKLQMIDLVNMVNGSGAITFTILHDLLEKITLNKIGRLLTLGKLKELYGKTLICVTYNMTVCVTEYLGPDNYPDLPCLTALRMSSNIPIVFERFKYMDNYYIDGGITDNFAILKGIEIGKKVLGICLDIEEQSLQDEPKDGIISYFFKLMQIPIIQTTRNQVKIANEKCKIIKIVSAMRNMLDFNAHLKIKLEMFSKGYEETKKVLNENPN